MTQDKNIMIDPVQIHFNQLTQLVALEEKEDEIQFRTQMVEKSPEERQQSGKSLLRLSVVEFHFSAAGHQLLTLRYADQSPLPVYAPDIGDVVILSQDVWEIFSGPSGTIYDRTETDITVAFHRELPDWVNNE